MITKYSKFNESIKSLLVGPTEKEIWKSLGYDRTFDTTEEFFLYLINGMKIKEQTEFNDIVFWEKNDKIIFDQKLYGNIFWVNYEIYLIYKNIFEFTYNNSFKSLITKMIEKYLNWKVFDVNIDNLNRYFKK